MKKMYYILMVAVLSGCASQQKTVEQQLPTGNVNMMTIQMQKQEIRENPFEAEPHYHLALTYRDLDSLSLAMMQLDSALELQADFIPAKIEKGALLQQMGREKDGLLEWYHAVQQDEDGEYVAEIAKRLGRPYKIGAITDGNYNNAYARYSPDGERIIFQSDRNGNWDIYVMDLKTKQQIQLTDNPAHDEMPVYSPNGKVIAFCSTRDDTVHKERTEMNRKIYLMDATGGQAVRVVETGGDDWSPSFTTKNEKLVLVSEKDDPRDVAFHQRMSDLYVKDLEKGTLLRMTQNEADDSAPAISPDGNWIIFVSNRSGKFQIYRMDRLGRVTDRLIEFDGDCSAPHYSRDGKRVAFAGEKNGDFNIYMTTASGTHLTQLTLNPALDDFPQFSPDGRTILFHSNRSGMYQIYAIDLESPTERAEVMQLLEDKIATNEAQQVENK